MKYRAQTPLQKIVLPVMLLEAASNKLEIYIVNLSKLYPDKTKKFTVISELLWSLKPLSFESICIRSRLQLA